MGCNNMYEYTYFYYIGSFNRFWACNRLFQLGQKVLLCLFLISLNTLNAGRDGIVPQAVLFLIIISGPVLLNVFYRTYRCASSNYLKAIFDAILFFTCVMNVIEADPDGFSSSFIDQYTFSDMMLVVNLVGLGCAGLLCLYQSFEERRPKHGGRDIYWPARETDLLALHLARPEMLVALNTGKRMLEEGMNTPEEFYPRQKLLDAVNAMRTLLAEAKLRREGKLRRSILDDRSRRPSHRQLTRAEELELISTLKLGEDKARALEWTLQDMVEDLSLLYNTITARVKAAAGDGTTGLQQELHRFERIQSSFEGFADSLTAKSHERALMHPLKQDFLAKMLVVRGIVMTGNENFNYGERPPWGEPKFLPPIIDETAPTTVEQTIDIHADNDGDPQPSPAAVDPSPLASASASSPVSPSMQEELKINIMPEQPRHAEEIKSDDLSEEDEELDDEEEEDE